MLCLDNFFTGDKRNIEPLLSNRAFELIRHDVTFPIFLEADEVYGDPAEHPQREAYWGNVNPIGPRSCYDAGKRCAETLFFDGGTG